MCGRADDLDDLDGAAGDAKNDQSRTMTPAEAVHAGASYLVVGRPITGATNPVRAIKEIAATLNDEN